MLLNEMLRASKRLGEYQLRVAQVRKFRNRYDPEQLAKICFVSPEVLTVILDTIDAHPDWDDEQIAENVDFG